jgi:hypothetical protein
MFYGLAQTEPTVGDYAATGGMITLVLIVGAMYFLAETAWQPKVHYARHVSKKHITEAIKRRTPKRGF